MTKMLIGCPVKDRNWILPFWKIYVEAAVPSKIQFEYVFAVGKEDQETLDLLSNWPNVHIVLLDEKYSKYKRNWGDPGRLSFMTYARNELLKKVRELNPNYFLSLDSDILIQRDCISNLLATIREHDKYEVAAVGARQYMDQTDPSCTSGAVFTRNGFSRIQDFGIHRAELIMAVKLMNRRGFNVDYEDHRHGEDIGWCKAVARNGYTLMYDARVANKHVMHPEWLGIVDKRVGF